MNLGEQLAGIRKARGFTLQGVALKAGLQSATVGLCESGGGTWASMHAVAKALGVQPRIVWSRSRKRHTPEALAAQTGLSVQTVSGCLAHMAQPSPLASLHMTSIESVVAAVGGSFRLDR